MEASGIKGHTPVLLEFKTRTTTIRALHLRKPPTIGVERVVGPLLAPPDWAKARAAAEDALMAARRNDGDIQRYLDDAYRAWADLAEEELADFAASPPKKWGERGRLPNRIWRSVVPENAPRMEHPHAAAAAWLSATAREVRRISEAGGRTDATDGQFGDDIGADPMVAHAEASDAVHFDDEIARARGRKPPVSRDGCVRVLDEIIGSLDTDMPDCGDGDMAQDVLALRTRLREAAERIRGQLLAGVDARSIEPTQRTDPVADGTDEVCEDAQRERCPRSTLEMLCHDIDAAETKATAQVKG